MDKIYFKGLNGIRAIAAFIVITFHVDQFLFVFDLKGLGYYETGMARYGVTLFFVLSGFLITFLLLSERKQYGKVEIGKFYTRRILRIWPLYYMIIFLTALFILSGKLMVPENTIWTFFPLYLLLVPNLAVALGFGIITLTPLWSVGVEEQFYAFWPWLLNKSKNIFLTLTYVVVVFLLVKILLRFFENGNFYALSSMTTFDSMAIGGIMANFVFEKNKILRFLYNPLTQLIAWFFLAISVFYKPFHVSSLFDSEIHAVFYSVIILNVSTNPGTIISLENKLMNFLGRISYGLYVYHMTIIWLLSLFLKNLVKSLPVGVQYSIIYITIYSLTILIAYLSYTYFEAFFLRRKILFSKVQSTN